MGALIDNITWVEKLPHPSGWVKWLFKTPILFYWLGLGFIAGRIFMVMTTVGRKSGQPRRTAIEFHEFKRRKYIFSGWGTNTDWYRNIQANPHITIQTWRGAESVTAHRITSDLELATVFEFAMSNPTQKMVMKSIGFDMTLDQFLAQKERFTFVTFNPTDRPTPKPLQANLVWVWAVLLHFALFFSAWLVFQGAAKGAGKEAGYLLGFFFYWLFWCLLIPGLTFRKVGLGNLLKDQKRLFSRENWLAGLLWIIVTATALAMYGRDFIHAPWIMILLAIPLATINGICEELLWRGLYVRAFPGNPWLGVIVPAIGFALWHFVPQTIFPAENQLGFVLSTLFLGLVYGFIAYRTGSAKWTAISHSLSGILALSGYLAPSLLALIE
jgi:uncharacterized protein